MNTSHALFTAGFCLAALAHAVAAPTITTQPQGRSVSRGENLVLMVTAISPLPITYEWHKNGSAIPDEIFDALVLPNVQTNDTGSYWVIVSDSSGSVTSEVATLTVDATFTKITDGDIVTLNANSFVASWGDYDNDGFLDLFVANNGQACFLYHNNGDGTFTRITSGPVVETVAGFTGPAWGDYNNDGFLDLYVATYTNGISFLFHNNGNGTFTSITNGPPATDSGRSDSAIWGDFDGDGFIDLFVANEGGQNDFLYHNNGDGSFTRITSGPPVTDGLTSVGSAWVDYDGDNDVDLFTTVANGSTLSALLYRNDGGAFTRITNAVTTSGGNAISGAWGDYDNDGDLDLFMVHFSTNHSYKNLLFRNDGGGVFTPILAGDIANDASAGEAAAWADYDNDGFLDLFVANFGVGCFLYHNNGDGTFTKVTTGSLVNDTSNAFGVCWGDYDNDGFLDLFVPNFGGESFLYRNNGNTNHWLKIKLAGSASNRAGLGTKVRVQAVIGGTNRWLLRQTPIGDGFGGGTLLADFGLGDATNVSTLRIEWPSGIVQEFHDVAPNQALTVTEQGLIITRQPRNVAVQPGESATNRVVALSDQPVTCQWRFNGASLVDQTNAVLVITNVQLAQEGDYDVVVTAGARSATSAVARLTVLIAPVIVQAPLSQSVIAGGSITLSVSVTNTATLPIGYRVRRNGSTLPTTFPGAYVVLNERTAYFTLSGTNLAPPWTSYAIICTNLAKPTGDLSTPAILTYVADSDGDGLADYWEQEYFGSMQGVDPGADSDGDGMLNWQEFLAGTDPTNAQSYLRVDTVGFTHGGPAARVAFSAVSNRTYTIESRSAVNTGPWARAADVAAAATNRVVEVTDTNTPAGLERYYRLVTPRRP